MFAEAFIPRRNAVAVLLLGCILTLGAAGAFGEATLYRDTWGVPYIYGGTDAEVAYAVGYAQAEDRLEDLFINVRIATGAMSEAFGPEHVMQDYVMRLAGNNKGCRDHWPKVAEPIRLASEAFIAGINAYIAEHPEKLPDCALELEPWHPLAIMRAMILNWPLGTIQDEISREPNTLGWGSNQWAVAKSRSAEGCPILLTDPHLSWEGMSVFYELHLYGDTLPEQHGYGILGTFGIAYGHTGHIGWAPTTGGPDTADVYVMKLNPGKPWQYEYDGEWRGAKVGMITIPVKGQKPERRPTFTTHLGPALSEPDREKNTVLVAASPYFKDMELLEQIHAMLQAKNAAEFTQALAMNHFMEQNLMFADREGNIGYRRIGRTPIRPEGYDWSRPVPGNTSATAWLGLHSIEDLVHLMNPPQGYMQNCNISPEHMLEDSPLLPGKYPKYIYNVSWDSRNSRGDRALQALSADDSITKEEAMELAFDITDPYHENWKAALKNAAETLGQERMKEADFANAVERILAWDGTYHRENRAAPLVRYWRLAAAKGLEAGDVNHARPLDEEDNKALLDGLQAALESMDALYGSSDVAWGDIIKVGRGGKRFPSSGAAYGHGENDGSLRTLLSVGTREDPKGSGTYVGNSGSMAMMLMFFHQDGIESYTCIPWGQSADPASPHYMDQGEKLYTQRKFKKVHPNREALLGNLESKRTFGDKG